MQISREDRVRMERAHVLAWPALNTAILDGWLWRASGGGSQRANSVSTIDFFGDDLEATLADVEERYRQRGAPARFQIFDETSPAGLATILQTRGYHETEPTVTMFKRIEAAAGVVGIEQRDHPWAEWQACYLGEITADRRTVNTRIVERIPGPRRFFGYRRDSRIISTALCVTGFGCAVIECVTTRSDERRQGAARSVLAALEAWAARQAVDWIGLQVVASNTPAVKLYQQLGFMPGATNRYWVSPVVTGMRPE
jgi:ribosomal protein S18 acetylase RimI-like enzyme